MPSITASGLVSFLRPAQLDAPTEHERSILLLFNRLFPELQGDLYSYLQDKTCGCKDRLIAALNRNPEQAEEIVRAVYKDLPEGRPRPEFAITYEEAVDPTSLTTIAGHIETIPADPEAYRTYIRRLHAERKVYQGICIRPVDNLWQLFFY